MAAYKFLGCSVGSIDSELGWGESPATLTVQLVEDAVEGDAFLFNNQPDAGIGNPYTFTFGNFRFRGVVQNWRQKNNNAGNPVYEVVLTDARDVLSGTQLITSNYYGGTSAVPNILNVFGYVEAANGYGAAFINDGGMPWRIMYSALVKLINGTAGTTNFGTGLRYKTTSYKLDISAIEYAPFFYRIRGNPNITLLDAISQRCNDAGLDYFFDLTEDNTIVLRTISRKQQIAYNNGPNSGAINRYVASRTQVASKSRGWELRNDGPTSKMLIGSNISELFQTSAIFPYWGNDANGNLLISRDLEDTTAVTLNSISCIDFIGPLYDCTVAEVRLAIVGQQAWMNYIAYQRPDIATRLGIASQLDINMLSDLLGQKTNATSNKHPSHNIAALNEKYCKMLWAAINAEQGYKNAARLHRLVMGAGQQYMGKSFVVALPFVLTKIDAETQTVTYSHDVDTEGGYTEGFTPPLGLTNENALLFEQSMNRLSAFAYFGDPRIDPVTSVSNTSVLQQNGAYVKAQVDGSIRTTPFPCVIVNLSQPILSRIDLPYGMPDYLSAVYGNTPGQTIPLFATTLFVKSGATIVPKHFVPNAIALPIRNNIFTYGAWWLNGAVGKTEFEQDTNLAPWNYGGTAAMNLAAYNRLFASATNLQVSELGDVEEAGLPQYSLGDTLLGLGSNITGITIKADKSGATTSYRLHTFDYRYIASASKKNEERLVRMGRGIQNFRARVREGFQKFYENVVVVHQAIQEGLNPGINVKSPHLILYGAQYNLDNHKALTEVATMTTAEAASTIEVKDTDRFQRTAYMSMNGLIRPFSTKTTDAKLPHFKKLTDPLSNNNTVPSAYSLNPFRYSNDILIYARGDKMVDDMKSYDYQYSNRTMQFNRQSETAEDVRGMALRGPLLVCGYGFNIYGRSVQDTERQGNWEAARRNITDDDRIDVLNWRAGPVDLLWDDTRGVWTPHTNVWGKMTRDASSRFSSAGKMIIMNSSQEQVGEIEVWNPWSTSVKSGKFVLAGYLPHANKMVVIASDC